MKSAHKAEKAKAFPVFFGCKNKKPGSSPVKRNYIQDSTTSI